MPALLPYPALLGLGQAPEIRNVLCYLVRHYGHSGLSVLIRRRLNQQTKDSEVGTIFGDWHGQRLADPSAATFLATSWPLLVHTMRLIRLTQAQFFFATDPSGELVLVDVQLAANKFAGPGLVRDLFGTVLRVQDTVALEVADDRLLAAVRDGGGSYAGNLIIKPSKFRTVERPPATGATSNGASRNGRHHNSNLSRVPASSGGTQPLYIEVLR